MLQVKVDDDDAVEVISGESKSAPDGFVGQVPDASHPAGLAHVRLAFAPPLLAFAQACRRYTLSSEFPYYPLQFIDDALKRNNNHYAATYVEISKRNDVRPATKRQQVERPDCTDADFDRERHFVKRWIRE